jgi:hypothetical protein
MVKSIAIAGTVTGWGSAASLIFISDPTGTHILVQNFALSVGILSGLWVILLNRRRPMSAAFELGYEMGRREGFKERNRPRRVTPFREYLEQREREAANG